MAPKWPMRQNSSTKTALNSTEGAEIQCTWRPSENLGQRRRPRKGESAITKRAAREQKHRLPLLRSDLDFYVRASSRSPTVISAEDEHPAPGHGRLQDGRTGCQPLGLQLGLCPRFMLTLLF